MENLDLQEIEGRLDEIDTRLMELFEKRVEFRGQVAELKIGTGKAVYDGQREKQKLDAVATMVRDEFNRRGVHGLLSQIMTISRKLQYRLLAEHGKGGDTGFTMADKLGREGVQVVCQSVEGAYSHRTTLQYFGEDVDVYHVPAFKDAMIEVEEGGADYGVLPTEDSSIGVVIGNRDNPLKHDICIVAETKVAADHAFLGLPEASLEDIRRVYFHPQGLVQCSGYLGAYGQWSQISVENTAGAVKKVLKEGDVSRAAVASPTAGALHGLKVLESSISNSRNNATRSIIVVRKLMYRKDAGKISICFEGLYKNGSPCNMLGNFIYNDVNMFMIESRPIEGHSREYRFFVDMEGSLNDPATHNALLGISEEVISMRILENYQEGGEDHGYQGSNNTQELGAPGAIS